MMVLEIAALVLSFICSSWTLLGDLALVALWPSLHVFGAVCLLIGVIGFLGRSRRTNYRAVRLGPRRLGLIFGKFFMIMLALVTLAQTLGHRINLKLISDTSAVLTSISFLAFAFFLHRQARLAAG